MKNLFLKRQLHILSYFCFYILLSFLHVTFLLPNTYTQSPQLIPQWAHHPIPSTQNCWLHVHRHPHPVDSVCSQGLAPSLTAKSLLLPKLDYK